MAGNNDEKIVRLPQLDRLTKSLDARNSTLIQNVHDELISAVEDVEKKIFSGDYNDLTNKPCYENQGEITFTYDGNSDGKITVPGELGYYVKISDDIDSIRIDSIEEGSVKYVMTNSDGTIEEPEAYYIERFESYNGDNKLEAILINDDIYVILKDNYEALVLFNPVTFPEKGIYFKVKEGYSSYYVSSVSFPSSGTVKQLDEKFIPDTIARMDDVIELEEDNLSMEGLIDETYPNLITQDKTILGAINELARMLNGLTLMPITQEAYDALAEKNPNVIYIITE